MPTTAPVGTEGAIWTRLLEQGGRPLSVAAARALVHLDFPDQDKARMRELAAKAREGSLTTAEEEETRSYERVGNLLALMKSKARQRLKKAAHRNGAGG